MSTRLLEQLIIRLTSDGAGKVSAELGGVGDSARKIAESSAGANAGVTTLAGALRALGGATGVFLALREIAGGIKAIGAAAIESEQADTRLAAVLRATGRDAAGAASNIEKLVRELQKSTGFDGEDIKNATARMLTFERVQGETLERGLKAGANLSALYGDDLSSAMQVVGRTLQDAFNGFGALERKLGELSPDQKELLENFKKTNDLAGAQNALLDIMEGKMGTVAAEMNSGIGGAVQNLNVSWESLLQTIGRTDVFTAGVRATTGPLTNLLNLTTELIEKRSEAARALTLGKPQALTEGNGLDVAGINAAGAAQFGKAPTLGTGGITDAQKKLEAYRESVDRLIQSQTQQAATAGMTNVATMGYRLTVGDLTQASVAQRSSLLLVADAMDEQAAIAAEVAHWTKEAARAEEEHTRKALETAAALDQANNRANARARDLADRGDKQRSAARQFEDDIWDIETAFQNLEVDGAGAFAALGQAQKDFVENSRNDAGEWTDVWSSAGNRFASGMGDAVADVFTSQKTFAEAMQALLVGIGHQIISTLVEIAIKRVIISATGVAAGAAEATALAGYGAAVAAAWAPAEAAVSLATLGANAVPASAAIINTHALTSGLALAGQAHDGLDYVPRTGTYLLEEGERVVKKEDNRDLKNVLNGGSRGGTVNFNIRAIDARGFDQLLRSRRGMLTRMMQQAYNTRGRGGLGPAG